MACRIDKLINTATESLEDSVDVQEAVAFMARRDLGSVVVNRSGQVIGLFTEKDLIKRVIGPGKNPKTVTLGEVCTRDLVSVSNDVSCKTAIKTMRSNYCRRLLVYQKNKFLGLVTLPEVAQTLAEQRSSKNALVNVAGGVTLLVTLAVIGLGLYQLPDMARLAMTIMK
jgi:signal-transduction protein with cAMP-binding, CBS, and nucleotidyltransferase domain